MPLSLEHYSVTLGKTWSLVFRKLRVEYANKPLVFPKLGEISPPPLPFLFGSIKNVITSREG